MSFLTSVGQRYLDFVVTKYLPISELNCILREMTHEPTGATVMHIENDDPENLFCLSFQTLPSSSNGVAHILEHTVLCGSKKYPVKDPFFAMNRRSLNTFMNAFTGADFTCYPAASQVEQDFYNLLDVYMDAVFHPELKELSFLQEGHRYEFADPKDPKSALEIKGIVYNEMKGSLNSGDARLWHAMLEHLFPDLPYKYNSGGDPLVIPELTYPELIAFHETFYHPSRCLFYFYGNLPLKKHLDTLAEKALHNVKKLAPLKPIPRQPRFKKPVRKEMPFPIHESEDLGTKAIIAFGWLTAPIVDQEEVLALSLLDSILMDTDASLLRLRLLESELCVQADGVIDTEVSEVPYSIICKGCRKEDADKLEKTLMTALQKIVETGIPFPLIESALHQLEFSRTEIAGDQSPFGLTLFMRAGLPRQHGCAAENALMIHSLFEKLLKKVKDPKYLGGLIQKHFIDNTHFVRQVMVPDPQLASQELAAEKETLQAVKAKLTEKEVAKILRHTEELGVYQRQVERQSLDCLPKIESKDIPLLTRDIALKEKHPGVFHHSGFTNHILYIDLVFDLPEIDALNLPYVQLFTSLLSEVGVGTRGYAANLEYMQAHTGGVGASCSLFVQVQDPKWTKPCLILRGKALARNVDKLCALLKEITTSVRFDEKKRVTELIMQVHTSLQNRLSRNALRYALQLALSGLSTPSYIGELWHGISYLKFIEKIAKHKKDELPSVLVKLHELKEQILGSGAPKLVISCDDAIYAQLDKHQFYGLLDLPSKDIKPWTGLYPAPQVDSQARPIASAVAFTAEAFKTISYLHPYSSALQAATFIIENKILHQKIREQGGAYGAGASYAPMQGHFYLHSYRDPHIASTLRVFQEAITAIASKQFQASDVDEAKLGMIQQFDTPISPGGKALAAYSWLREGKSKEMRQHHRDKTLGLTVADVAHAVEQELLPQKDQGIIVTFASKELIAKENASLKSPLPLLPI